VISLAAASVLAWLTAATAPGCPVALAAAAAERTDAGLAQASLAILGRLERGGAGGPTLAVARAARLLSDAAEAGAPDLAAPARAFRAALARHCELAGLPQPPFATAADRASLDRILSREEFRHARTDPLALRRLLLSAWAWLLDRLGSVEAERWASLGRAVFLLAAAAAVAAGAIAWVRRRRGAVPRPRVPAPAAVRPADEPDRALALAEEALRAGELLPALRHALLAALAALERAGRLPRGRALTNREILRSVSAPQGGAILAREPASLVGPFDAAVYGGRAPEPGEVRAAVEGARRVRALLGSAA